eukprot:GFYU01002248.1.p1 GENE.GFYU01002248.1~~GFYU01002248.1.p1  ORF type:complete len:406 (-),score=86.45 GFYU01002248.1:20-1237(-)
MSKPISTPAHEDLEQQETQKQTETTTCCTEATRKATKAKLIQHHLPLGLIFVVLFGYGVPTPGIYLAKGPTQAICVSLIFFISGLTLKTDDIKKAINAYKAIIYGIISILLITPMAGFLILAIPWSTKEFGIGLALFAMMPTTLSSCVILTRQAGGNFALALLLTVTTNLLGIVTLPFIVDLIYSNSSLTSSSGDAESDSSAVDPVKILVNLLLTILMPLAVGKFARSFAAVGDWVTAHKTDLKLASSFFLILVPFMKVSKSAEAFNSMDGVSFVLMLVGGILVHVLYLLFNFPIAVYGFRFETPEAKAVVFTTTQKTLPVALTILEFLPDSFGEKGLIAIACIVAHLSQILVDSFIVAHWTEKESAPVETKEPDVVDASSSSRSRSESRSDSESGSEDSADDRV